MQSDATFGHSPELIRLSPEERLHVAAWLESHAISS
jgi:hypothetical protein